MAWPLGARVNAVLSAMPLLDALRAWRDRVLADPRFVRWAVAFPPARPFARRHARALFDLAAGFVYSQVLAACVRLDVFRLLAAEPLPLEAFAARTRLPRDGARRLLEAAVSLRLLERRGGDRFGLGPLGAALIGQPGVAAMVEHHALLYDDLRDPVALLRGERRATALAAYWPYAGNDRPGGASATEVSSYTALMSASQGLIVEEVLAAHDFSGYRCLLDIGGGDGTFLATVAARYPQLRLLLFDLPPVAALARARFERAGLAARAQAIGGDFLVDELPPGADAAIFVRVLHDHDDERVLQLLHAARRALPDDGTLLIAEPLAGAPGAETVGAAYFGFYLLAMGRGRARTPGELRAMLSEAGFAAPQYVRTRMPLQTGLLIARVRPRRRGV